MAKRSTGVVERRGSKSLIRAIKDANEGNIHAKEAAENRKEIVEQTSQLGSYGIQTTERSKGHLSICIAFLYPPVLRTFLP